MKKITTRYRAGPAYYRMCSTDVCCSNKPTEGSSNKETITVISSFLELGRRKLSMQPKICGGAENVVKTETQQTFGNGLLGLYWAFILRWESACVLLTIIT